ALAETGTDFRSAPDEARATLHSLRQEYPEWRKFLEHRFARLPDAQRQAILALFEVAPAPDMAPLLQQWSHSAALPLRTRARALRLQEHDHPPVDTTYRDALSHAVWLLDQLGTAASSPLAEDGTLPPPWPEELGYLPLSLALDVARELAGEHPDRALAVLRTVRPAARGREALAWAGGLADNSPAGSAMLLQDMLVEGTDKGLHKAIRKALHRLKVQGVAVVETQTKGHTVVVGTVAHRLEKCLASFIDGAGDRMLFLVRTKPMGGYNMAYL